MPLLIADIGGTTSRWACIAGPGTVAHSKDLPGYNPATGDPGAMQAALRSGGLVKSGDTTDLDVIAYGAGCGAKARAERMRAALAEIWPRARIAVESDLLGAARALYGDASGLVLILGTGMNAGHYDGGHLHLPMPSLGYMLGDEGSGADIGKHLLHDALYGQIPGPLLAALFPDGLDLASVLEGAYRSAAPQAFLASHTAKLAGHLSDHYAHDLVASRFVALARVLAHFFSPGELREVRAIGSVASGFREVLGEALAQRGMKLSATERDPMPGLVHYHLRAGR